MSESLALASLLIVCGSAMAQEAGRVRIYIDGYRVDPDMSDPRSTAGYAKVLNESTGRTMVWNAPEAVVVRRYVRIKTVSQDDVDAQRKRDSARAAILKQLAEAKQMRGKLTEFFAIFALNKIMDDLNRQLARIPP